VTNRPRPDAHEKVAGRFEFANDLTAEGMLHGAILRSPHPHARIRRIDTGPALALDGVVAVVTAADMPGSPTFGLIVADQPVFASDVVRYAGEPVAAVAATDVRAARRAAAAITVEYEEVDPVCDPQGVVDGTAAGRVYRHQRVVAGEPTTVGAVQVEGTYEVGVQDPAFLGPEAALAIPDPDGNGVHLLVATQSLHDDRRQIAAALGLEPERVLLTLSGVGGAFGGREELSVQIPTALLALRSGRPVRIVLDRRESFLGHPHRHPAQVWMRHHADPDGRLVKIEARIVLDGGAYQGVSPAVLFNAVSQAQGPYRCPHAQIEGWTVQTNNPPSGAMRGFGVPQVCFAHETQMDQLADACGLDPVELRTRNALEAGDRLAIGQELHDPTPVARLLREVTALPLPPEAEDDARARPGALGLASERDAIVRGVGYGLGMKNVMYSEGTDDFVTACCTVADGVATLELATCEVGQGFVVVAEAVARSVLDVDAVVLAPAATTAGPAGSTSASRTTWMAGAAIAEACRQVREQQDDGKPEPLSAEVEYHHRRTEPVDDDGQGDAHVAFAFVAQRAVVDVDVDLGLVRVVQVATAQDVGTVVHPLGLVGQIEGGIAQGLGLAVLEELLVDDGVILNPSFGGYLVPTAMDAPDVAVTLVTEPEPLSPLGAKGVGELPCITATPAIVAAIRAATGRALTRVPVRLSDLCP
jgi:CO/xanthine dehydrogenase Mo-binding subunit